MGTTRGNAKSCIPEYFVLEVYFSQGGMELKDARLVLVESWEEKIKAMVAAHRTED